MVYLLAAMTSFGLLVLGCTFVVQTMRHSGAAILAALTGQKNDSFSRADLPTRRPVRVRLSSEPHAVAPSSQMRAAA
jgi:hypothetical protein